MTVIDKLEINIFISVSTFVIGQKFNLKPTTTILYSFNTDNNEAISWKFVSFNILIIVSSHTTLDVWMHVVL